jgi:hypothetical protein
LEYENSPLANAALISGSDSSARATRTFSRAATLPMPALPVEPLRRAHEAVPLVRFLAIELGDQLQEAIGRRVEVPPELGDLGFESVEGGVARRAERSCGRKSGAKAVHGRVLWAGYMYSNLPEDLRIFNGIERSIRRVRGYR